ncbi:MAG: rod shape-determining protein [Ardenticatenaceae bacterium]|nr:rod shape-determining protein [Ardenticatenaceae bacterium]
MKSRWPACGLTPAIIESRGSMVVDIGGGTTEVAVFAMGGIVVSRSIRVAGDEMDEDIIQYVRSKYNLLVGERMAERVKIGIGSAFSLPEERTMTVRGRNLINGLPQAVEISSIELREAMGPSINIIVDTVRDALDDTPPELVADLMEVGVCIAGGGAQIRGLAERLEDVVKMRVWVAEDSMTCVARGAGRVLEDLNNYARVLVGTHRGSTHH